MSQDSNAPFVPPLRSSAGNYLRMGDLKNRPGNSVTFRFITAIDSGYEKWTAENRPHRIRHGESFPAGVKWRKLRDAQGNDTGVDEPAKEFNCAGVYNLDDECVQVFSWTQKKFNKRLEAKVNKSRKGHPMSLALTVTRLDTQPIDYDLDVEKAPDYTPEQQARIDEVLENWTGPAALFGGGDPFETFDRPVGEFLDDVPDFK